MNLTKKQVETLLDGAIVYMDELREEVARLKDAMAERVPMADFERSGAKALVAMAQRDAAIAECEALKAKLETMDEVWLCARESLVVTSDAGDSWGAKLRLKEAIDAVEAAVCERHGGQNPWKLRPPVEMEF